MELQETKRQLWNSIDAKFHCKTMTVCAGMLVFLSVILALLWMMSPDTAIFMLLAGCFVLLPLLLWRTWKLIRIISHADQYVFFRAKLGAPKGNHKVVSLSVNLPNGKRAMTDRIYYLRKFQPRLSDWLDKTATVAWNQVTGVVIVIGE